MTDPRGNYRKKAHDILEVQVTRGNLTESVHMVDAVVVDSQGEIVEQFGDPSRVTYPRSSVKPLQALLVMGSGAAESYGLSNQEIAMACSSHSGDSLQTGVVRNWLARLELTQECLVCGAHWPYDEKEKEAMIKSGKQPERVHNNCSGKHTGLVTFAKFKKYPLANYDHYDHPVQQEMRRLFTELSGENLERAPWGIDGCGIPTYGMSLVGVARSFRVFFGQAGTSEQKTAARKIQEAITKEPHFIGGRKEFDTDIARTTQGRAIVKTGAEGFYAGFLREQGLTFALKVRDGASRASRVTAAGILFRHKGLSEAEMLQLSEHTRPEIKNWSGTKVGKIFVPSLTEAKM